MPGPRRLLVALNVLAVLALASSPQPAAAAGVVPTQWIAKVYTEGLGRLPDQTAWQNMVAYFQTNGCSAATLQAKGEPIYNSAEFNGLGYDNASRLLSLYRGSLNREPDSSGFNANLSALNQGQAWSSMVTQFFTSSEFGTLVSSICSTSNPSYAFGTAAAIAIPLGSSCTGQFCFSGGTQSQLQSLLDQAPAGGTVSLDQQAVVTIDGAGTTSSLVIPAGKTLETFGQPGTGAYARMGRLVRVSSFVGTAMVKVQNGARLLNVWVDGQRGVPANFNTNTIDVEMESGSGTVVSASRISNTAGWTNLHALGNKELQSVPCASNTISDNVVTAYSSSHFNQEWSDGLSIACENALVKGNQVVDGTDVDIVLFRATPAVQKSTVTANTVLSAGNPSFGGIVADPLTGLNFTPSFAGSSIDHNTLWTGENTYFEIALSVGTRPWFTNPNKGFGASFTFNTTGSQSANVNDGIVVGGMTNVTVQNNTLHVNVGDHASCSPRAPIVAAVSAGWASGSIQGPFVDADLVHCV